MTSIENLIIEKLIKVFIISSLAIKDIIVNVILI